VSLRLRGGVIEAVPEPASRDRDFHDPNGDVRHHFADRATFDFVSVKESVSRPTVNLG
jgi:hypothetical protein